MAEDAQHTAGGGGQPAGGGAESGPPPLLTSVAPAPSRGPSPQHQKLALYAGGALVVLTLLVILLIAPGRQPLELVPRGQAIVQVVDVKRFLASPIYAMLAAANHPILIALENKEERFRISLRRDVAVVIDTDDSTILVGRFQPKLLRDCFEEAIEIKEKELNRGRQTPIQLQIKQSDVEGSPYFFCDQEGVDYAFASVGSSMVCFGDRWGVRRFLKGRVGVRGNALDDGAFAAAYSPGAARGSLLYRLEKPGGKIVAAKLRDLLDTAAEGLRATFFAVTVSRRQIGLVIRFAARDPVAAEKLEARLGKASAQAVLRQLLGAGATAQITRADSVVTLHSTIPLDDFEEAVEKDKKGQGSNLILALLAS